MVHSQHEDTDVRRYLHGLRQTRDEGMALACGNNGWCVVREDGAVVGTGPFFQARGYPAAACASVCSANRVLLGPEVGVLMVATSGSHQLAVSEDGALYTWGYASPQGKLGHADAKNRLTPEQIPRDMLGGVPVLAAACGLGHTLVVTADGGVWTCGCNYFGQLGREAGTNDARFGRAMLGNDTGTRAAMPASGDFHNVVVAHDGDVWTWGLGEYGSLGQGSRANSTHAMRIPKAALGIGAAVLAAAAGYHAVVLGREGEVCVWGRGEDGQLGLGDRKNRSVPARMHVPDGTPMRIAACGYSHTMLVTPAGALWVCGDGGVPRDDTRNGLGAALPVQVPPQAFGGAALATVSAAHNKSMALTVHGLVHTWGLEHRAGMPLCTTPQACQEQRVGRWQNLRIESALAFAMGTQRRLGLCSCVQTLAGISEIVSQIIASAETTPGTPRASVAVGVHVLAGGPAHSQPLASDTLP